MNDARKTTLFTEDCKEHGDIPLETKGGRLERSASFLPSRAANGKLSPTPEFEFEFEFDYDGLKNPILIPLFVSFCSDSLRALR